MTPKLYTVVWSDRALRDLTGIRAYIIGQFALFGGTKFSARLVVAVDTLNNGDTR